MQAPEEGRSAKTRRFAYLFGSVIVAMAIVGSGSAFAASHSSPQTVAQAKAHWRTEIAAVKAPGRGCYHAEYPTLRWHATKCLVAPAVPLAPRIVSKSGGPSSVGNAKDYSAKVSGTISKATGTFNDVSSNITEKGQIGGEGSQVKNAFSLQLNSEFFSTPVCSKSGTPSECEGWQQFVYAYHYSGDTNEVFMQYWLLYWDTTCPKGWSSYSDDGYVFCYTNSAATSYGSLPAKDLGDISLVAQAKSGGNDQITLSSTSGQASTTSGSDSMLDLASVWNTTEWNVFGDAGGGAANFGAGTTLEPQTTLTATSSSAPTCLKTGYTAETNNLNLTKTPALGSESSPTMASRETNSTAKKASCAVAG